MADKGSMTLDEVRASIMKKHGPGMLIKGSEIKSDMTPKLSTGCLSFDIMLGGGFAANQFNQIVGEFSSGKTAMAALTVVANQRLDPDFTTVWVAAEGWTPTWFRTLGMDDSRVDVINTNVMEEVFDMVREFSRTKEVDLIVLDSLPALMSKAEEERTMEDFTVGVGARQINKFFRLAGEAQRRSMIEQERPCTGIVINQWREKIGVMHGDNRTTPGGKGKDFAYYTNTEVRRTEWIEVSKQRVGQTIRARTHKNKQAPVQRVAEVDFYFESISDHPVGYDRGKDIVGAAMYLGVVEQAGAYYRYKGQQWQGKAKAFEAVADDMALQADIRFEVMRLMDPDRALVESPAPKRKLALRG